jgi:hypothetical protein
LLLSIRRLMANSGSSDTDLIGRVRLNPLSQSRRSRVLGFVAVLSSLIGTSFAFSSGEVGANGITEWEVAEEIPGQLSGGNFSDIGGLSCANEDACVTVGSWADSSWTYQATFAEKSAGTWGSITALPLPSSHVAGQSSGAGSAQGAVSCTSGNFCVVGGYFAPITGQRDGFLATRQGGTWTNIAVPGLAALVTSKNGTTLNNSVVSVSCAPGGQCAAVGQFRYGAANNLFSGWLSTWDGTSWSSAIEVPGLGALNTGGNATVNAVRCPSDGNCVAIGTVNTGNPLRFQGYITELTNGVWSDAFLVPGLVSLNQNAAAFEGLACATFNECVAAGRYWDGSRFLPFVVTKVGGTWGNASQVPGFAALAANPGSNVTLQHSACSSAGNCVVAGQFDPTGVNSSRSIFVADLVNGTWQDAIAIAWGDDLPADAKMNQFGGLSCSSPGNCAITGQYNRANFSPSDFQAFLITQSDGTWSSADLVPGVAALVEDTGGLTRGWSVSCVAGGACNTVGILQTGWRWYGVATLTISPPAAPTALVALPGNGQIEISFTAGDDFGEPITNYEYTLDEGETWIPFDPAVTESPVTLRGLTNGTEYVIRLRAVTANAEGAQSESVTATPVTPTVTPETETPGSGVVETTPPTTTTPPTRPLPVPGPNGAPTRVPPGQREVRVCPVGQVPDAATDGSLCTAEVVEVFVDNNDRDLVVQGAAFNLRLSAECSGECRITSFAPGRQTLELEVGGSVRVQGSGFTPGSQADVWLFSDPKFLGSIDVAADGSFAGSLPIGDIDVGEHTLQINGVAADGQVRSASLGIVIRTAEVPAPLPELPATGSESHDRVGAWSVLLLALGALAWLLARRPEREFTNR